MSFFCVIRNSLNIFVKIPCFQNYNVKKYIEKHYIYQKCITNKIKNINMDGNEELNSFKKYFCLTAAIQGRIAYFLMSLHAPNPYILTSILSIEPYPYLFANMVYGIGILIYTRPSMSMINPLHRLTFSVLGSMMFNHGSVSVFYWIKEHYSDRPVLLTILGYLSGRVMIIHLLAFLYHMDTRTVNRDPMGRDPEFEEIILGTLMFNNCSCMAFEWIRVYFQNTLFMGTFCSFALGRVLMFYLLTFLYHIDKNIPVPGYEEQINVYYEYIYGDLQLDMTTI